jgi:hypothetical protein
MRLHILMLLHNYFIICDIKYIFSIKLIKNFIEDQKLDHEDQLISLKILIFKIKERTNPPELQCTPPAYEKCQRVL